MRHAARKLTNRSYFLTLKELCLLRFKFGCISEHRSQTGPLVCHAFMQRHFLHRVRAQISTGAATQAASYLSQR